jgi:hypothetical protein
MTQDQIIEAAIQGHASTRDAIRWSMQQEREECAKVCEKYADVLDPLRPEGMAADYFQGGVKSASRRNAAAIRARGEA